MNFVLSFSLFRFIIILVIFSNILLQIFNDLLSSFKKFMTFASSKCFTYLTICCSLMHKDVIWSSSSLLFSYPMKNLYPFHKDTFQILLSYWYPHCLSWLDFWKNGTYCNQFRQYRISKIARPSFKYTGVKILFNWREDSRGYFYMRSIC